MLLGCGSLGASPGMLLAPVWPCWPLDWKPLGPSSWCGVRPHRWAALGAGLCFCSGAQGEGTLPSPGCPGSTPGCRQQCCARVPPCMSGSQGGGEQAVGVPNTHRLPRQRRNGSALLVSSPLQPAASHPASPQLQPWAPPNCCCPPPLLGDHSRSPGPGLRLQAGATVAGITDDALQLLCQLQAGSRCRLEQPISGIGMCGLKSILLVQLSAARCWGWWVPLCVSHPPAFPLFFSSRGPAMALLGGALPVGASRFPSLSPASVWKLQARVRTALPGTVGILALQQAQRGRRQLNADRQSRPPWCRDGGGGVQHGRPWLSGRSA